MRILIGTTNTANAITSMAHGFRDLGHDVTTAAFEQNSFYPDQQIDIMLPRKNVSVSGSGVSFKISKEVHDCLNNNDMYIFIAASSLLGRFEELPLLYKSGKKIVIFCMGSEIRHKSVAEPFWNQYGYEFPDAYYPAPSVESIASHPSVLDMYINTFANKVYNARIAERYASAIFSDIPTSTLGLRPFYSAPFPFDHGECVFHIPARDVAHIVHAPSARAIKKTDVILGALETLRAKGVPFTFELIENRPNSEVLAALTRADILIDQIGSAGGHGRLSLEGAASGCAVVGCNNLCTPYPPGCPIIKGEALQLTEQLRILCENKELRIQLAVKGRTWMAQGLTHPRAIAERMIGACAGTLPVDYYPTAFMDLCNAPEQEPLPDYLQQLTLAILQKYGCHPDMEPLILLERGLVPAGCEVQLRSLPRWKKDDMHEIAPWAWCGKHIPSHAGSNTLEYHLQHTT